MKKLLLTSLIIYQIIAAYTASLFYTEIMAYIPPKCEKADISQIIQKGAGNLTDEDYLTIFGQTGLGKPAVDSLESLELLSDYQENYFIPEKFDCKRNSPVSCEERITGTPAKLAPLQDGDILVTNCSHVLSWRNGHAAIVIDAEKGITLEAVVIGMDSKTQNISKWTKYPNFAILRLKNADEAERAAIAANAMEHLNKIPYNVFSGFYPAKYCPADKVSGTQCAHLVWLAYAYGGYDIDSDKGLIVTPNDILNSGFFEIVQTHGMG